MNGFLMQSFLTVRRLHILYNEGTRGFKELHRQIRTLVGTTVREIKLSDIHNLLCHIFKDHINPNYLLDAKAQKLGDEKNENSTFKEPYTELFVWSLLTNKSLLVDYFWERTDHPILNSVIAAGIYSKLSNWYRVHLKYDDTEKILPAMKLKFQNRAKQLIDIAFKTDPIKVTSLLERRNPRWGDRNMMEISYIGYLRTFIASPWCVSATEASWKRGFVRLPWLACILFFFPFIAWTPLVKFQPGLGDDGGKLNPIQKIFVFYRTPMVKYVGTCVSYLGFLILYSYVILFGFRYEYQIPEIVVYGWIVVLILDEMREYIIEPSKSAHGKLRDYVNSVWNKFDITMYLLAILAFILRNFYETFWLGRILMVFNGQLFFFRVFRVYHASWKLGPKLIIIHRMIPEIVTFITLLAIFITAYGVANQAIINPYRDLIWENIGPLLNDIIVLPYWQMYGDLQLERIEVSPPMYNATTECGLINKTELLNGDRNSICNVPDAPHFKDYNTFTQVLLALYLLIAHVMLLNLLIAIFTSVFEAIHVNSHEVWKWEMYRLVGEYDQRPGLPAPLVVIELFYKVLKSIWKKTCRRKKENLDLYMQETIENLRLFEKDCTSIFVSAEESKEHNSLEKRIQNLENKTNQILEIFDEAPDDGSDWGRPISTLEEADDGESSDNEEFHDLKDTSKNDKIDKNNYSTDLKNNAVASEHGRGAHTKQSIKRLIFRNTKRPPSSLVNDPVMDHNQLTTTQTDSLIKLRDDLDVLKTDIKRLESTFERYQTSTNCRFDKLESEIGNLCVMTKELAVVNKNLLKHLENETSKISSHISKQSPQKSTKGERRK